MVYEFIMQTIEQLKAQLASNDFMAAGAMFAVLGSIWYWVRGAPVRLYNFVKDKLTYSVEFLDHDPAYFWVASWIAEHYPEVLKFSRRFTALATHGGVAVSSGARIYDGHRNSQVSDEIINNLIGLQGGSKDEGWDASVPDLIDAAEGVTRSTLGKKARDGNILVPSPGSHLMKYSGAWMILNHQRISGERDGAATYREELTIKCAIWRKNTLQKLIDEARVAVVLEQDMRPFIYSSSAYGGSRWEYLGRANVRPLDSVLLQDDIGNKLLKDLCKFYSRKQWYLDRGIPWRTGLGLTGPPGNGKTSLIGAMAFELGKSLCTISLASAGMSDDGLQAMLMDKTVSGALVVIEDIDCVRQSRIDDDEAVDIDDISDSSGKPSRNAGNARTKLHNGKSRVTLSGLLNALDGLNDGDGRVVFMTTNFPERLDPALKRPGRMDQIIRLDNANLDQIKNMYIRFFPDGASSEATSLAFARLWHAVNGQYSMAQIQQYLMQYAEDAAAALNSTNVAAYIKKTRPNIWTQDDYYAAKRHEDVMHNDDDDKPDENNTGEEIELCEEIDAQLTSITS